MRRRNFIAHAAAGLALARPACLNAQSPGTPRRIGVLMTGANPGKEQRIVPIFTEAMRVLGWVDGRNVQIDFRTSGGDPSRYAELAATLVRSNVDVIVTNDNYATRAALAATASVPIVMAIGADVVRQGFVDSLAHPGRNVTGLSWTQDVGITAKYPELLREMIPGMTRLGCVIDSTFPGILTYREVLEAAAEQLKLRVRHVEVRSIDDLDPALADLSRHDVQAVFFYYSQVVHVNRPRFLARVEKYRLPDMYISREHVDEGRLMSYGVSTPDLYRRAAGYVDRILRGARPGDLPVEQPTLYELVINRTTASRLGLTIPRSLLARAEEIVE
jgi:putative ABC transport system substrate-binding protein